MVPFLQLKPNTTDIGLTQVSKWECNRADGRDLIREWKSAQESLGRKEAKYVATKEELDAVDPEKTDSLLGKYRGTPSSLHYWVHVVARKLQANCWDKSMETGEIN